MPASRKPMYEAKICSLLAGPYVSDIVNELLCSTNTTFLKQAAAESLQLSCIHLLASSHTAWAESNTNFTMPHPKYLVNMTSSLPELYSGWIQAR